MALFGPVAARPGLVARRIVTNCNDDFFDVEFFERDFFERRYNL